MGDYLCVADDYIVHDVALQPCQPLAMWRTANCLTRFAYCPKEPNAMPFPPRQVMLLARMFVEFYEIPNVVIEMCETQRNAYAFDG
jgi:hypothetical protein